MDEKENFIYDEDESVAFIQNYLPQEMKGKFSNDDINYIVDLIYEFYESKGFLKEDSNEDAEVDIDEDELVDFVIKNAKRDGVGKIGTHISFLRGRLIADARRLGHFTAACSIPGWKPLAGTIDIANHRSTPANPSPPAWGRSFPASQEGVTFSPQPIEKTP